MLKPPALPKIEEKFSLALSSCTLAQLEHPLLKTCFRISVFHSNFVSMSGLFLWYGIQCEMFSSFYCEALRHMLIELFVKL